MMRERVEGAGVELAGCSKPGDGGSVGMVLGEAPDGDEGAQQAEEPRAEVILRDPNMPGLEATRGTRAADATVRIVVMTLTHGDHALFEAIKAGATAYVLKDVDPDQLIKTVCDVARGEAIVSPTLAARIIGAQPRRPADTSSAATPLTARETEVVDLLSQGHVNKDIAQKLGISPNTVKNHLKNIMKKLRLENRVQLAAYAFRQGLVEGPQASQAVARP